MKGTAKGFLFHTRLDAAEGETDGRIPSPQFEESEKVCGLAPEPFRERISGGSPQLSSSVSEAN
jgi:hypothetical protein